MKPSDMAEQAIIGALLTDLNSIEKIYEIVEPEMFTDALLGLFYVTLKDAYDKGKPVDVSSLVDAATRKGYPPETTASVVFECNRNNMGSLRIAADGEIVAKASQERKLNEILSRTPVNKPVEEQISYIQSEMESLAQASRMPSRTLSEIAGAYENEYFKPREVGLEIGFPAIDDMLGGLEGGDLIIIAARPSVGKSAFAAQVTSNIADMGKLVSFFNLEMKERQMYERFLSTMSGVSMKRIRNAMGYRDEDEKMKISRANERLKKENNISISTGSKTVSQIYAECKRTRPDIVIIDYMQLLTPESHYVGNRYAEVGAISHALKSMAMSLNIPVVVLSQLNRNSAVKDGVDIKEPSMSELRESGDMEQDASQVMLLWNTSKEDKSLKALKVEKNRQGKVGRVDLIFNGDIMKFQEQGGADDIDFMPLDDADNPFPILED